MPGQLRDRCARWNPRVLKIMKIMIFEAFWLSKRGFRAVRCRAMFKIYHMTRRAFCSVRVIRLQRAASSHVQNNWPFYDMEGGFSQISRDPQIHFWRDQFFQIAYQISRRMVWFPSPFNLLWCPGNWRTGARHETLNGPKSQKLCFLKHPGSQNGVFEPRGAALPRNV